MNGIARKRGVLAAAFLVLSGCPALFAQVFTLPITQRGAPAPGIPAPAVVDSIYGESIAINDSSDALYYVKLRFADAPGNEALYLESMAGSALVGRRGDPIPNHAGDFFQFGQTDGFNLGDQGQVAFHNGFLPESQDAASLWIWELAAVPAHRPMVRMGATAPGTAGVFVRMGRHPPIQPEGAVNAAFWGSVVLPDTTTRQGIWIEDTTDGSPVLRLLALEGTVMPGIMTPVGTGLDPDAPQQFRSFLEEVWCNGDYVMFRASGNGFHQTHALYAWDVNQKQLLLLASQESQVTLPQGEATLFGFAELVLEKPRDLILPSPERTGKSVLWAGTARVGGAGPGIAALFRSSGSGLIVEAVEGGAAPWPVAGAQFSNEGFRPLAIRYGVIKFRARVTIPGVAGTRWGIWERFLNDLRLVAHEGMAAPGIQGATFGEVGAVTCSDSGQLVLVAQLREAQFFEDTGVWAENDDRELMLVHREFRFIEVGDRRVVRPREYVIGQSDPAIGARKRVFNLKRQLLERVRKGYPELVVSFYGV